MEVREELQQEILLSQNGKLQYVEARNLKPISEWKMTAGELKRIPQFYNAVHAYSDTLKGYCKRTLFYNEKTLCEWEEDIRSNTAKDLPVIGFFEMKQDIYDTSRRLKFHNNI